MTEIAARVYVATLSLCLLACRDPAAVQAVSLQTDHEAYSAVADSSGFVSLVVVLRLNNESGNPVYLSRCSPSFPGPIYGVELVVDKDQSAYSLAWACSVGTPAITVPPAGTRFDTLHLFGPTAFDGVTHAPIGTLAGRFYVIYETQGCVQQAPLCPGASAPLYSNPFRVTVAAR